MGYTAKQLVSIAEAEIGYHEKATNANLDSKTVNSGKGNYTKYSRDLYKAGYYNGIKQGFDWCDQFVDWCFYQLCGKHKYKAECIECQTGNLGAGCGFSLKYYKQAGRFDHNPKVGDQIFFKYTNDNSTADHTGIVVRVTDSLIETIEGNSGNEVKRKAYQRNDKTIIGYGHPRYDAEPEKTVITKEAKNVQIEMPILRKGSSGNAVKTLQRLLRQLQYTNIDGKSLLIVDGHFGSNTEAAVKRYQQRHLNGVDGIVGVKTWNKLLKGR